MADIADVAIITNKANEVPEIPDRPDDIRCKKILVFICKDWLKLIEVM